MSSGQQDKENGGGFADSLREIQGEYMMLGELYEKQKSYGQRLSEMMKTMQLEVDTVIPIRPEALGRPCRAAYLVSEGVVVVFDPSGALSSKPLYMLPSESIISIIQECTPELQRLLSEKRRSESNKVKSMERVLKELKKAQATFKQTKREDVAVEEEEEEEPASEVEQSSRKDNAELVAQPPPKTQRDSFAFRGSFGDKKDVSAVST
jgi:hypothetical protein